MTGTLACLTDIKDIMGCSVGLPNGQHITATKEGTVLLSDTLTLTNVLYVPSLNCNLVSVSQLVNESNRVIAFSDKFCVTQDHTTRTLIGMGEQREGLYYLGKMVTAATIQTSSTSISHEVWHKRLGHPSNKVIDMMFNSDFDRINKSYNQVCDIFLRAKHSRESFPISKTKTFDIF